MQQVKRPMTPPGYDLVDWIFGFVGTLIGYALGTILVGVRMLWRTLREGIASKVTQQSTMKADSFASQTAKTSPVPPPPPMTASVFDELVPEYIPAEIRRIELEDGYLTIRYSVEQQMAKCKLVVTNKKLKKFLQEVIEIPDLPFPTINEAVATLTQRAQHMVADAHRRKTEASRGKRAERTSAAANTVVSQEQALSIPGEGCLDDIPQYILDRDEEPPFSPPENEDWQSFVGDNPSSAVDPIPTIPTAPPPTATRVPSSSMQYRGILVWHGWAKRDFPDKKRSGGARTANHYCAKIIDHQLKIEQSHWGNDLERAIKDSGVSAGDDIELGVVGSTPVMVKGKPSEKKVWAVQKR